MGGQIYVFVSIGTHEARTRSKAANQNMSWSQKMLFPSCGTTSVINVKVFTESSPLVLVASKVAFAPCFPPRSLHTCTMPRRGTPCGGGALDR